jgi:hypothetical protein
MSIAKSGAIGSGVRAGRPEREFVRLIGVRGSRRPKRLQHTLFRLSKLNPRPAERWHRVRMGHVMNSKRPLRTLDDFKGLKIRVQVNETHLARFRALVEMTSTPKTAIVTGGS